jgi:predicted RNase H-like HicB family nuclease
MAYYTALIFGDAGGYGFTIPDIPGFTAHAETEDLEKAVAVARRVLAVHLAALIDHGGELPSARTLKKLKADRALKEDFEEADAVMLLPALLPAGRTRRVNVTLDENTLNLIDRSAADRKLTRSAFIAEAARQMASG